MMAPRASRSGRWPPVNGFLVALSVMVLAMGWMSAAALWNRHAGAGTALTLSECRVLTAAHHPLQPSGGLRLRTVSLYKPAGRDPIPEAALATALGLSADRTGPRRVFVAVEAAGPAVAAWSARTGVGADRAPLVVRDAARDRATLIERYAGRPGIAVTDGLARIPTGDAGRLSLDVAVSDIHLTRPARRLLADLPANDPETACEPRFMLTLVYGALGRPYLGGVDQLAPVR